jgi:hypothetical protein
MTGDFMDLAALEKLAAAPEMAHHATYLVADIQRVLPALGDPARALSAVQTLQKWAGAEGESLRKGFATAFLERAKAALGNHSVGDVVARHATPVRPGADIKRVPAPARFRMRGPAPRIQAETTPSGRLNAPMDTPPAEAAHRGGAKLAGLFASHGFKLGLAAAGGVGVAHGPSDSQRKERSIAAKARWSKAKSGPSTPTMAKAAHPGFARAQAGIARRDGISHEEAGAILAAAARGAGKRAKKCNPPLKRVEG